MATEGSGIFYSPNLDISSQTESFNEDKRCSVRGCSQTVSANSQNKMCDACRGRHRVYASTKRMRRKMEKASLAGVVDSAAINQEQPWGQVSQQSWDQSIDPRLYDPSTSTSSSPAAPSHLHPLPVTSSSSELANALTLPTQYYHRRQEETETETVPVEVSDDAPPRYCSVKGCKAVIPGSYQFKMCPPCRTRYRTYGTTKRAKWKAERDAFDREMADLRAIEDEKRKEKGLLPLAECPEELREWEISVIDEQVPLPPQVLAALSADGLTNVYHNNPTSIDTPNSVVPYPQVMGIAPTLPARMCTVSHCHQILPGFYRYKRCEQHRLQNRHHSKLKRVREKVVKASGPEEGASLVEIPPDTMDANESAPSDINNNDKSVANPDKVRDKARKKKVRVKKRKEAEKSDDGELVSEGDEDDSQQHQQKSSVFMDDGLHPPLFTNAPIDVQPQDKDMVKTEEKKRRMKHSCNGEDCQNLLNPEVRWRLCEDCRTAERRRRFLDKSANKVPAASEQPLEVESTESPSPITGDAPSMQGQQEVQTFDDIPNTHISAEDASSVVTNENGGVTAVLEPEVVKYARKPMKDLRMVNVTASSFEQPKETNWTNTSTASSSDAHSLLAGSSLTFKEYKPKTAGSAIGRLLAQNPHVGVEVFKELLLPSHVDLTKLGANTSLKGVHVNTATSMVNSLPTPTIPQSTPFVYYAPSRKAQAEASSTALTSSHQEDSGETSSKGKDNNKSSSNSYDSTTSNSQQQRSPSIQLPPGAYAPYQYQYPYPFPYYIPSPYAMPPYPYLPPPITSSDPTNPSSSSGNGNANTHPNFNGNTFPPGVPGYPLSHYQYPYLQQPYGYPHPGGGGGVSPPGYSYIPSRYMPPPYGTPAGQHPFALPPGTTYPPPIPGNSTSGIVSSSYAPATTTSDAAPPEPTASTSTSTSTSTSAPQAPKDTRFTFYHYRVGDTNSPKVPDEGQRRKRRKVDPAWLEKMRLQQGQVKQMAASKAAEETLRAAGSLESTPAATPRMNEVSTSNQPPQPMLGISGEPHTQQQRTCHNKACHRVIPAGVSSTLCDKCKARFKKRQAKTKQRFKLEPRKSVLVRLSEGDSGSSVHPDDGAMSVS